MTQCWHITVSTDGRMPLFADEAARRAAVRAVHRVFEGRLVLFCFADEHAHVVVLVTPGRIGRTRTSLVQVPRPLVAGPLAPPHARPIESRRHLSRLVPYILGQMEHHRLPAQPALWSGSCFQDLVEARCIGGARLRLWDLLPRERPEALLSHVGLPAGALGPAPDEVVRAAGATRLSQAAAAAVAAPPDLPGRSEAVCVARRAAARLADEVGLARPEIAWALCVSPRALRRIATRPAAEAVCRAARVRLALEDRVAQTGALPPPLRATGTDRPTSGD